MVKYFMDIIAQATEILRKPIGWIELDLTFDLSKWKEEAKLAASFLVPHREGGGHNGWRSCCIHGQSVEHTGTDLNAPLESYHWTELSMLTPTITNFWKSIPTERFARLRFMELASGGHIAPHNDSPNGVSNTDFDMMDHMIPINVAIVHPDDCYMTLDGHGTVPFSEGKAIIVNITNTHSVVNNSPTPRMHMIAHCVIGNKKKEFAELVVRSYNKQYECGKISTI
jgi:hypothetical protein